MTHIIKNPKEIFSPRQSFAFLGITHFFEPLTPVSAARVTLRRATVPNQRGQTDRTPKKMSAPDGGATGLATV